MAESRVGIVVFMASGGLIVSNGEVAANHLFT